MKHLTNSAEKIEKIEIEAKLGTYCIEETEKFN